MQPLLLTRQRLTAQATGLLVSECLQGILSRAKPRLVLLFGSAARGEMTDQSDLDIMAIFDTVAECREASRNLRKGGLLVAVPVDLICITWAEYARKRLIGGVCMIAAEDGRVLYRDANWTET